MKIFRDIEQGTPEWEAIRRGKPTASRFSDIVTTKTGELSKSCDRYIRELIGEIFCPDFKEWEGNKFTEHGKQFEAEAREAFVAETGLKVEQVGFCLSDDGVSGCSPDGLVFSNGKVVSGVEIKCKIPRTHIGYVLDGGLPDDHKQQVHGSMAVTGMNEWHFWSYYPGMRHHHVIVKRDSYTEKLSESVSAFVQKYKEVCEIAIQRLRLPNLE